jgi:flavin-dependent dehydrogenase
VDLALPDRQRLGQFSAVARRRDLDAALVALAERAGAEVHQGAGLTGVAVVPGAVRADIEGVGTIEARHLVAADGMWSPTRRLLGDAEDGYLGEWHAFRQYLTGVTGPAAGRQYVWFEPDVLPGYAWSFPVAGEDGDGAVVNFGFGVPRDGRRIQDMKRLWADLLARPHITAALGPGATGESRHLAWPIPARIDAATLTHGPVLYVGDAVGACDVMTGEGIGQALTTGVLAGRAITSSRDPLQAADRYQRDVRAALVADHHMSAILGKALRSTRGTRAALGVVDLSDWTRRNFARWMFEDEPRAALVTPRRWHRQFLRRPGAYLGHSTTVGGHAPSPR